MKSIFKALALASISVSALSLTAVPAAAQSKLGIGVVNIEQAVGTSSAATTARSQMETTYKATIDSFNARKTAIDTELKQKADALQAGLKAAGGKSTPALQTQYEALQTRQQQAQAELQRLGQPLALANAYVEEQIGAKLGDALKNAMKKANVDLVLAPDATVSYAPTVDITAMVVTELNALVPAVGIVPPAGWRPGGQQQAGAPAAAAAPAASAQPAGR
ncbi:MAG: OmpH family outer membrane protein [Sphingobium sp.]|jgi:Skp family chaperone for outer membrane proteins|nr:OmpH family outer membrane protein [Sphingobium sp.]MCI1272523.1 OmpH family outer membrane protein [Sphingobium sp.]MCI1755041.1 OmpH family outer membrane protein [Sphingobium sp.]MCI2053679.1 OmpH family outer membrane protein [Sphingobium sp.]